MYKGIYALILLFFGSAFCAHSQQALNKDRLDNVLKSLYNNHQALTSVAVYKDGKILYNKAYGFNKINGQDTVRSNALTKYRIGSITKMFTAVIIFQLIEEGKISLNTTLATYYPQIKNSTLITISDLLSHKSGLHNLTDDPEYQKYYSQPLTEDVMIAKLSSFKPDFVPGAKMVYSNSNFILLGYIVERVTGKSYAEALKLRIINRIDLKSTQYGNRINSSLNEASSFSYKDNQWTELSETNMSIPGGAGAIISTPTALTQFVSALFSGKFLNPASLSQMQVFTSGIGRGLMQILFYDMTGYGHDGSIDGFRSEVAYFPSQHLAVSVISNGLNTNFENITKQVYNCVFNKYDAPSKEIKLENISRYEGSYSSLTLPLKITIKQKDGLLTLQATGQQPATLETVSRTEFAFAPADIILNFTIKEDGTINQFVLKQQGGTFTFTKE
jgi:D-alanyl-D-alanine carboxypeptidase